MMLLAAEAANSVMRRRYRCAKARTVRDFSPLYGNFPDGIRRAAIYVGFMRSSDAA